MRKLRCKARSAVLVASMTISTCLPATAQDKDEFTKLLNDAARVQHLAIEDVAKDYVGHLTKAYIIGMLEKYPYSAPLAGIIFPEDNNDVDYDRIRNIVAEEIKSATNEQSNTLAEADMARATGTLKSAISDDTSFSDEASIIRVGHLSQAIAGELDALEKVTLDDGRDEYKEAFKLYMTSRDVLVGARRHIWNGYRKLHHERIEGARENLIRDINASIEGTTRLAREVVLRTLAADARKIAVKGEYPFSYLCSRYRSGSSECMKGIAGSCAGAVMLWTDPHVFPHDAHIEWGRGSEWIAMRE